MTDHRRAYQKAYKAKLYARNRTILDSLKNNPCADCGRRYPPQVMEFDHRNPAEKKYNVGDYMVPKAFQEEIAKCDVVCANCHCIRTYNQRLNARKERNL